MATKGLVPRKATKPQMHIVPKSHIEKIRNTLNASPTPSSPTQQALKDRMPTAAHTIMPTYVGPSDLELENQAKTESTLLRARQLMDENLDEVKKMNQIIAHAKCAGIRELQLREKALLAAEKKDEEKHVHEMLETDRQRAINMYEEREKRRKEISQKEALVLRQQIAQRENERQTRLILKEQECEQIRVHMEHQKELDRQLAAQRKQLSKDVMAEVLVINNEQQTIKRQFKEEEKEEDRRNFEFIKAKDAQLEELEAEKARRRKEKDIEHARQMAMFKKAADERAAMDELKARRAQEQTEREWRARERAEAQRVAERNRSQMEGLAQQVRGKDDKILYELRENKIAREHMLDAERGMMAAELERERIERESRFKNAQAIRDQIKAKSEKKLLDKNVKAEDKRKLALKAQHVQTVVEGVRDRKLKELRDAGVPEKYLRDLLKPVVV